jgi:hypothetical protein
MEGKFRDGHRAVRPLQGRVTTRPGWSRVSYFYLVDQGAGLATPGSHNAL